MFQIRPTISIMISKKEFYIKKLYPNYFQGLPIHNVEFPAITICSNVFDLTHFFLQILMNDRFWSLLLSQIMLEPICWHIKLFFLFFWLDSLKLVLFWCDILFQRSSSKLSKWDRILPQFRNQFCWSIFFCLTYIVCH